MKVVKASGEIEEFNPEKLVRTLIKAGATERDAKEIIERIKNKVYDGITTGEILELSLEELEKVHPVIAAKYDLKRAVMKLGPAGFHFEKFFARILQNYGYSIELNRILRGKCVTHEIDIIARKKDIKYLVECKFHNYPGIYSDVKVPLYVYSRFLDLKRYFNGVWLATNTKFSLEAIEFSECMGIKLTGWRYPRNLGLEQMIERKNLYPITILKGLDPQLIKKLLDGMIVLVKDLASYNAIELSKKFGVNLRTSNYAIEKAREFMMYERN